MATCVRALGESQSGFVVANDPDIIDILPLPLAGLLSEEPALEVVAALERLNNAARELGCVLPAPFMTLSFISLPTVPELGLTDMGIVDVQRHELVPAMLG
jgi:adenine deaminase